MGETYILPHRPQARGNAVEMGKKETSKEKQQMGEKQVLARKMWKAVVIKGRKHNSVSDDGYANSQD